MRGLERAVIDEVQRAPELHAERSDFLECVLLGKPPTSAARVVGAELVQRVLAGGYPEALERSAPPRRQKWFTDYARAVIERDVRDIAQIEHVTLMPRLLRILAQHSGQLVNYSGIGAPLAAPISTLWK